VARATGDSRYIFRDLERGTYAVEAGGRDVLVGLYSDQNIDSSDLSPRRFSDNLYSIFEPEKRKYVAAFLILAANIIGSILICRIARRG